MLKEFKEFAMRGNVVDLAVGVIIGAAFGKVVSSMVNDIIMPPIGKAMGGVDFKDLFFNLDPGKLTKAGAPVKSLTDATDAGAAVIAYGSFINNIITFLIIAFCVFMIVKAMNMMKRKPVPVVETKPAGPTKEEILLTEIRDAIRTRGA
jgi:large conductance mechanosensitive channel